MSMNDNEKSKFLLFTGCFKHAVLLQRREIVSNKKGSRSSLFTQTTKVSSVNLPKQKNNLWLILNILVHFFNSTKIHFVSYYQLF
jgi:hypothetical protein